jgi:methyl-accepting chemotaxis protein
MARSNRRRRIADDGKFQFSVAMRLIAYVYVYLVFFAILANLSAIYTVVARADDTAAFIAAVERLEIFAEVFVLPLGFTFVVMCLHGMFLTRRLSGPLSLLRATLRQVRGKVLPAHFRLRRDDYFRELCEEMDGLLSNLRGEVTEIRTLSDSLSAEATALRESGDLPDGAHQSLLNLSNGFSRLRQLVNGYRLEEEEPEAGSTERKGVGAASTSC